MWRVIASAWVAFILFVPGCKRSADVVEGGVYAFADSSGGYTISKVLVADEFAVHLRSYKESFKAVPASVATSKLTVFMGHAPLARDGFLKEEPKLITVEPVAESELEGYRYYQEAMGAGR